MPQNREKKPAKGRAQKPWLPKARSREVKRGAEPTAPRQANLTAGAGPPGGTIPEPARRGTINAPSIPPHPFPQTARAACAAMPLPATWCESTALSAHDFIYPVFVHEGATNREAVALHARRGAPVARFVAWLWPQIAWPGIPYMALFPAIDPSENP